MDREAIEREQRNEAAVRKALDETEWLVKRIREAQTMRHEDVTRHLMVALRDAVERLDLRLMAWRHDAGRTDTCQPDPLEAFDPDQYPVT